MSSLDDFKLYYEEMENKVGKPAKKPVKPVKAVKKTDKKPKSSLKKRIMTTFSAVRVRFYNIFNKLKPQSKKKKKLTKADKKLAREQQLRGILGIGLLFVVVSITYSSYVIFNGVDSSASRVVLIPQVLFALITLYKAFSKIYK